MGEDGGWIHDNRIINRGKKRTTAGAREEGFHDRKESLIPMYVRMYVCLQLRNARKWERKFSQGGASSVQRRLREIKKVWVDGCMIQT